MSKIFHLQKSFKALPNGFTYSLKNRWVWKYILLAMLVNLISLILVVALLTGGFYTIFYSILNWQNWDIDPVFHVFVIFLFVFISLAIGIFLFSFISSVANSPVYSNLIEKVIERELGGMLPEMRERNFFEDMLYTVSFEIKKLVLAFFIFILSSLLNLIPGIGSIVFVVFNVAQVSIYSGLDMFEPIWVKQDSKFRHKIWELLKNPVKYWPFTFTSGSLNAIPVVNIFTIPISTIGAILLYVDLNNQNNSTLSNQVQGILENQAFGFISQRNFAN